MTEAAFPVEADALAQASVTLDDHGRVIEHRLPAAATGVTGAGAAPGLCIERVRKMAASTGSALLQRRFAPRRPCDAG